MKVPAQPGGIKGEVVPGEDVSLFEMKGQCADAAAAHAEELHG